MLLGFVEFTRVECCPGIVLGDYVLLEQLEGGRHGLYSKQGTST